MAPSRKPRRRGVGTAVRTGSLGRTVARAIALLGAAALATDATAAVPGAIFSTGPDEPLARWFGGAMIVLGLLLGTLEARRLAGAVAAGPREALGAFVGGWIGSAAFMAGAAVLLVAEGRLVAAALAAAAWIVVGAVVGAVARPRERTRPTSERSSDPTERPSAPLIETWSGKGPLAPGGSAPPTT